MIVGLGGYIVGQNKFAFDSFQAFRLTGQPSLTPSPEATQAATPTPTQTSTQTAQGTANVTPTPSPKPASSSSSSPSPTPTPTPTPGSIKFFKLPVQTGVSFSADKTTLARGQCAKLSWNVSNASSVSLTAGSGSPEPVALGNQTKEVCPPFSKGFTNQNGEDTVYTLKVKKSDGSTEEKKVVITVKPIRVDTTFNSLKVLNSAAKIFDVSYNGGAWPKGGFGSYGSGEQVDISNDTIRFSPLAINEDYILQARGDKDEVGMAHIPKPVPLASVNLRSTSV